MPILRWFARNEPQYLAALRVLYLGHIAAYDKQGPSINALILANRQFPGKFGITGLLPQSL